MRENFDPTSTTVDEVHEILNQAAAAVANQEISKSNLPIEGSPFHSSPTGLGIVSTVDLGGFDANTQEQIHGIVRQAFKQVLQEKAQLLAGIVLAEARNGRNYFDKAKPNDLPT